MSNWCKAAICALALALPAPAAHAGVSLAGTWSFRAVYEDIGCVISGEATLTPGDQPDVYEVAMTARETCGGVEDGVAMQRCVAQQTGAHVAVRCTIVRTIPERGYLPDDFDLEMRGANRMEGLLTANWNQPAVWRRSTSPALVS